MKVVIADISSFAKDGRLIGHWPKAASMYKSVLNDDDVKIAGSKDYCAVFNENDLIVLPYGNIGLVRLGKIETVKKVIREILNAKHVMKVETDILIFQSSGFLSMLISCLLFKSKSKKMFFIQYRDFTEKGLKKYLYFACKNRFNGVMTSSDKVGIRYGIRYCVVPDYFYDADIYKTQISTSKKYDCVMVGTMNPEKDIEDLVESFSKSKKTLLIRGAFRDKSRLKSLIQKKTDNVTIEDRYITDEEYKETICSAYFCILPYKKIYNNISSGVVYDSLFLRTPVIATAMNAFGFVKDMGVGIMYNDSISEIIGNPEKENDIFFKHNMLQKNIESMIQDNIAQAEKLKSFICK